MMTLSFLYDCSCLSLIQAKFLCVKHNSNSGNPVKILLPCVLHHQHDEQQQYKHHLRY